MVQEEGALGRGKDDYKKGGNEGRMAERRKG